MPRSREIPRSLNGEKRVRRAARAVVEQLELRQYMAGVVINEFLANNNSSIIDQDNDHSDWIEIRNTDATSVNLNGWSLTDDAANLGKWHFPSTTIPAGGYLLVYASGKNRAISGQQLHTNFSLDNDGEYLALVKADGTTIADSYNPYPPQDADISYGRGSSGTTTDALIDQFAPAKVKVPTAASGIDSTWKNTNFVPDGTWISGATGVGFDTNISGINFLPFVNTNVQTQMRHLNTSVYIRMTFDVADPNVYSSLNLKMLYDDGFGVYLNGVRLNGASGMPNAEKAAPTTLGWNSAATESRTDADAVTYTDIDITAAKSLLVAGTNVLAIHGLNVDVESTDLLQSPLLLADRAIAGTASYMATPTPGAVNNVGTLGFVNDTVFSVKRGYFTAPFTTTITTTTPGASIRYTTNGTPPSATNGTVYTGPINITTTTTLRAIAYKTGWTSTNVDTQTYLFLNDVIHQTDSGLPSFAPWGHDGDDWKMDQNVVTNPTYASTIIDDLKSIPSMSVSLPWADMFGSGGQGIYISGTSVERAASVEYFSTNPAEQFHINSAIEIQGHSSTQRWKTDKLSFEIKFKDPYGPTKLDASIFTNPTFDKNPSDSFDRLVLDSVLNDSWLDPDASQRAKVKYVQDQFTADLQNLAGGKAPHGKYVHLYLNGLYWGMYYLHEKPDETFASDYLGGDKDDYDIIKHDQSTVVAGGSQATTDYQSLLTAVRKDLTVAANYNALAAKLDIDDFIDYMIINQYLGNEDWARHNWYASYNRVSGTGKWRFHSWDAEIVMQSGSADVTQQFDSGAPTEIHLALSASSEYKLKFADHVQKLMRNGGLLTPGVAGPLYAARANMIDRAIVGESARWGDNRQEPPYTRADWRAYQDSLLANYFPNRTATVLNQFTARGLIAPLTAPNFSNYGGTVNPGTQLTITKPGGSPGAAVIYYTIDGTDPRNAATNGIAGTAAAYSSAITLNVSRRIKARIYNSGQWSAVVDATFLMPTLFPLRISELHYHPANHAGVADPDDIEFIELVNTSASTINLQNVQITGAIDPFTFGNLNLAAGARIVVPHKVATFDFVYGTGINRTATNYTGKLDNAGEAIQLLGPLGETLQSFVYDDAAPWPVAADGDGPSLEITNPLGDPSDPANWHASFVDGGTPGFASSPPTVLTSSFAFNTGHGVQFVFDHDLDQSSFAVADLDITLQPGGSVFHPTSVTFPDSKTALFNFATPLADGNYHATLLSGSVKDLAGLAIATATDLDFYALKGDANRDRKVDSLDQAILTAHLNQAGNFADGDFDLSGTVNSADQTILNSQLKLWLPTGGALALTASSGDDAYRLKKESATVMAIYAGSDVTPTYRLMTAGVTSLSFAGSSGNDTLIVDASAGLPLGSIPLNFDGGNAGTDTFGVVGTSGTDAVTFATSSVTLGVSMTTSGVEARTFDGSGGGDSLTINDVNVALAATQKLSSLTLNPNATLDLKDRGLAIDYTPGNSPLTSITNSLKNARNGGLWNLPGITTSMVAAKLPSWLATLGVAEATNVASYSGSTAIWRTQTVDQSCVLVSYTYAGDANLDGKITGDDYFRIDAGYSAQTQLYRAGDFNYDNKVNADDYFLIDSNYNKAQSVLAAGLSAPGATATAEAEIPPSVFAQEPLDGATLLDELM